MNLESILAWFRNFGGAVTRALSPTQLLSLLLTFAAVVGLTVGAAYWISSPTYRVLFSDLDPESAGAVVDRLKADEVDFQLDPGGRTVRVPSTEIDQLRLKFASGGLPSSGRIGFEIFDRTAFGATEFLEQVNFRRALEGEIARTITALSEVAGARVHIALPQKAIFGRNEEPAKASVVLKLRSSGPLSTEAASGISNLVAASVEGLQPDAVVLIDSYGRALNMPDGETEGAPTGRYAERRAEIEGDLGHRVVSLLEPVVGVGRVRANVAVELESEAEEATAEVWDPTTSVVRSRHVNEAAAGGTPEMLAQGVAGSRTNLPPAIGASDDGDAEGEPSGDEGDLLALADDGTDAAGPAGETAVPDDLDASVQLASTQSPPTQRTETTNYEISKSITRTVRPAGDVARLSVAVILDDQLVSEVGEDGETTFASQPREAADLEKLRGLVAAAVGLDPARGDLLTVENVAFEETAEVEFIEPPIYERYMPQILEGVRVAGVLALALVAFLFGIRPLMRKVSDLQSSGSGGGQIAGQLGDMEVLGARGKVEALSTHAGTLSTQEPETAARLVRAWLTEEKR